MRTLTTHAVLARFGKALADPTRAAVLMQLKDGGDPKLAHALTDLLGVILAVEPVCARGVPECAQ